MVAQSQTENEAHRGRQACGPPLRQRQRTPTRGEREQNEHDEGVEGIDLCNHGLESEYPGQAVRQRRNQRSQGAHA